MDFVFLHPTVSNSNTILAGYNSYILASIKFTFNFCYCFWVRRSEGRGSFTLDVSFAFSALVIGFWSLCTGQHSAHHIPSYEHTVSLDLVL